MAGAGDVLKGQKQQGVAVQTNPQAANKVVHFENTALDADLCSTADILTSYQVKVVELPHAKRKIKIQSLGPGDQLNIYGSVFHTLLAVAGIDEKDEEAKQRYYENLTPDQLAMLEEVRLRNFRRIAVRAVISLPLRMKPQHLCDPGELSVWRLSDPDILFLAEEVSNLSGWSADARQFQDNNENSKATDSR